MRIGFAGVLLLVACPAEESEACANDGECKGDRLCIDGECQDPEAETGPDTGSGTTIGTTTSPDPTTSTTTTTSAGTSTTAPPESTSAMTESSGEPEQPYGICRFECADTTDCCAEYDCEGGNTWTCDGNLCRSQCVDAECEPIGAVIFGCVTGTIDIPGSSFCGATCDNTCSDVIDDPAYYCNMEAGYTPEICSFDCGIDPTVCNGSNGAACLPDGTCGCYEAGDCAPGYTCFKQWR